MSSERLQGYRTPESICFECRREYFGKDTPCDKCNLKNEEDE